MNNTNNRIIKYSDWNTYYIEDLLWISMYMVEDKYLALGLKPHVDYSEQDIMKISVHLVPYITNPHHEIRMFNDNKNI